MNLKPGMRLPEIEGRCSEVFGTTYGTQVMVVQAFNGEIDLRCCVAALQERSPDANGATSDLAGASWVTP